MAMLTPIEAAKRAGISRSLVYKLCDRGKLRYSRIGFGKGMIRISEDSIQEYLDACEVAPQPNDEPVSNSEARPRRVRGMVIEDYVPMRQRRQG